MESRGLCIICDKSVNEDDGRVLGLKANNTIRELSIVREDQVHGKLDKPGDKYVHTRCYKHYSKKESSCVNKRDIANRLDRSERRPFGYQTHYCDSHCTINLALTRKNIAHVPAWV